MGGESVRLSCSFVRIPGQDLFEMCGFLKGASVLMINSRCNEAEKHHTVVARLCHGFLARSWRTIPGITRHNVRED